jgi:hypothetical protein
MHHCSHRPFIMFHHLSVHYSQHSLVFFLGSCVIQSSTFQDLFLRSMDFWRITTCGALTIVLKHSSHDLRTKKMYALTCRQTCTASPLCKFMRYMHMLPKNPPQADPTMSERSAAAECGGARMFRTELFYTGVIQGLLILL